jgi:nitrite reductase (NADH) small subunit
MQSRKDLIKIASTSDLPGCNEVKEFFVNGRFLCVANVEGEICAMDNVCPHWGGPLGRGRIKGGKIVCPWHGWTFDPKTGETPRKTNLHVAVHKITIEGEEVFVAFADAEVTPHRKSIVSTEMAATDACGG